MTSAQTLHGLLTQSARSWPENTAIVDPEHGSISYRELDRLSDGLRDALVRAGVEAGSRVGICAPKSIGTVTSIFGILKAQGAYVPVDFGAPPARNAYIFKNCSVRALIVARDLLPVLQEQWGGELHVLEELDALKQFGTDLLLASGHPTVTGEKPVPFSPDNLSYILYTSGSTGTPKGVMHSHRSALSFIDWCSQVFEPRADDRFSSHAPFHFDLSILDLYLPIKHGARVIVIGEELGKQPLRLAPVISEAGITVWYSTPSILRLLVEFGKLERHDCSTLRIVHFAGEVFPVKQLRALLAVWPHPRYFNLYGPTETNVCTYYPVSQPIPPERTEPLPIGRDCSGDTGRVVDENNRDVARGQEGELIVSGGSVMLGYWNLPEQNQRAFHIDEAGLRWYRTGDIVKVDASGDYVFLGRRDRMVKRRSYRVELGEIEAALYRHPAVSEAAVVALPDQDSGVQIKAFLACADAAPPSLIELKSFCARNLPAYMIPDRFAVLGTLPKTSTDKIDYQRLKELQ